jgi:esterase
MKLFYRELGDKGKHIVILHGLFGSSDNWLTQSKMLSSTYHVYLVDLRNHGQSPHSAEFNYGLMADDLNQFVRDHGIQGPVVVGHSLGGKAALSFAFRYSDVVGKLVIVDICTKRYPVQHAEIFKGLRAIPVGELTSRNEADEILARFEKDPGVRQFLLKNLQRASDGAGFTWKFNLDSLEANIAEVGKEVTASKPFEKPTLFVRGKKSSYVSDDDLEEAKKIFSEFRSVTMDTGHWVQAEQPKQFVDHLVKFISEQ